MDDNSIIIDQEAIGELVQVMQTFFGQFQLTASTGAQIVMLATKVLANHDHEVVAHEIILVRNPDGPPGHRFILTVGIWSPTSIVGGPWHASFNG